MKKAKFNPARTLVFFMLFLFALFCQAQSLEIPLVSVQGSSLIYKAPNEVHFSFTVETSAQEIADARKQNEAIVNACLKYLREQGVEKKYIQSQHMSVGRNYTRNRKVFDGYIATQTIFVCLTDVGSYGTISDGLLQKEISRLSGPVFKTSDLKTIKNEARRKAMLDARDRAKLLAEALGQRIGKAKLISEVEYYSNRNTGAYSSGVESGNSGSDENSGFAPGQLEIKAVVNVSFKLLD